MGRELEPGDRVKLTDATIKYLSSNNHSRSRRWPERRGTVVRVSAVTDNVTVQWDDRVSVDQWPKRAVEKVLAGA